MHKVEIRSDIRFRFATTEVSCVMTNDKDEAKLAEKLTKIYNTHCKAKTSMTLASVQAEVKKFLRDKKEMEDLM